MMQTYKLALLTAVLLAAAASWLSADDWPMLARNGTRNSVSPEKNPPPFWQIDGIPTKYKDRQAIQWTTESKNIKWTAADQQPVSVQDEPAPGGHWPQWRGPNRDNVSTETGLLQQWPEGGPPLLWRVDGLPEGIASVSIADGRICTIGRVDDVEYITTLDEKTGQHLWTAYLGRTIPQSPLMQWLTQRTPTVAGQQLYAASSLGDIVCLQTDDGREVWRKSCEDDLHGQRGRWGYADRPLVDGDRLIVMPGGETGSVTALNRWTGEVLWKCAIAQETYSPYGVGVIAEIHGVRQFVAALSGCLVGIAVEDGRLLWRHEGIGSPTSHNILTPLVRNHHAVFPIGFRGQQLLSLEIVSKDDGYAAQDGYAVKAWLDPFEDNTCVVDEHLYIFGTVTSCHCWSTGEVVWQTRMVQHKTTGTYAGGRAYLRDAAGTVKLLEISPAGWVEHGKFVLPEAQCASGATLPVIAGGRLYLRDDSRLFCYDVREDAMERPLAPATTIQLPPLPGADAQQTPGRPRVGINRAPDAVFVPTPHDVVVAMLQLAGVEKTDVVYDLGSGDGRIVIAAAKTYEAKAVGVEIDPELVQLSRQQVTEYQLEDRVTIRHEDIFQTDFSEADVVAVFLFPQLLDRLKPQFEKLKPGTRIVSHQFEIPGGQPDQTIRIRSNSDGELHRILLWTTPLKTVPPPE